MNLSKKKHKLRKAAISIINSKMMQLSIEEINIVLSKNYNPENASRFQLGYTTIRPRPIIIYQESPFSACAADYKLLLYEVFTDDLVEVAEVLQKINVRPFVLSENMIDDIAINQTIFDNQSFEYDIIDREDYIEKLIDWISECTTNDKGVMKADLFMLNNLNDDYIFSSISTNEYIHSLSKDFASTCRDLLDLNETI